MKKITVLFALLVFTVASFSQDFDIKRAVLFDSTVLHPFKIANTILISKALENGQISKSDKILVADFAERKIAFLYNQMAYHHVAFKDDSKAWMVSFCVVCNSGSGFYTKVGNRNYHFEGAGLYDGVIILKDYETGSLWNHITGECVYGKMKGKKMSSFNLLYSTVEDIIASTPSAQIAISNMSAYENSPYYQLTTATLPKYTPNPLKKEQGNLGKQFLGSIAKEDTRLPNMTLGLGVWNDRDYRFFPSDIIINKKAILENLGGTNILVYNNVVSNIPIAILTDANEFTIKGDEIHLSNGQIIRNIGLVNKSGKLLTPKKPMQMFTRWYGFALTFPSTKIYASN